jgi:hypothetical protein
MTDEDRQTDRQKDRVESVLKHNRKAQKENGNPKKKKKKEGHEGGRKPTRSS